MPEENLEIDPTGNPFVALFPKAVEFKIRHLLSINFDFSQGGMESIDARKQHLLDAEVEILLYPTEKKLKQADIIFQALTEITALMAFVAGGVNMFGWHFEVNHEMFKIGMQTNYQGRRSSTTTEWILQERR